MELALLLSINCSFAIISCWQPDTHLIVVFLQLIYLLVLVCDQMRK